MAPVSPAAAMAAQNVAELEALPVEEASPEPLCDEILQSLPGEDVEQGDEKATVEVVELSDDDDNASRASPATVHSDRLSLLKQQLELLKLARI